MAKILIIGQAPGIRAQTVPYDTTLLYTILEWVGIGKGQAQGLFEFEALSNEFPGLYKKGHHAKPSKESIQKHWIETLEAKVQGSEKVWLLGNFVSDYFKKLPKTWSCNLEILETYHPSRRNYSKIMAQKETIIKLLTHFLSLTRPIQ